jgi:hypothetical protein
VLQSGVHNLINSGAVQLRAMPFWSIASLFEPAGRPMKGRGFIYKHKYFVFVPTVASTYLFTPLYDPFLL